MTSVRGISFYGVYAFLDYYKITEKSKHHNYEVFFSLDEWRNAKCENREPKSGTQLGRDQILIPALMSMKKNLGVPPQYFK